MKCDKCGEDIKGAVINRPDGEKWCHGCAKIEKRGKKNAKRALTKDGFILTARKLADIYTGSGIGEVMMTFRGQRVYTNGHVLIGERDTTPKKGYKVVDLDSFWKSDRITEYPKIERVFPDTDGCVVTIIPEEFYPLLKAFEKPKPKKGQVVVKVRANEIVVEDKRDEAVLIYGEFDSPIVNADFDMAYLMAVKPRDIIITSSSKAAYIMSFYTKGLEKCTGLIMPMQQD